MNKFGPGFAFAAGAVGVSHLVQSVHAGAVFGFSFIIVIVLACFLKYPTFRFGSDYAAVTGNSLIYEYRRQGPWAFRVIAFFFCIETIIATAAITLVAAALLQHLLGAQAHIFVVFCGLIASCSAILALGRYRVFEGLVKILVALFIVFTLAATMLAIPKLASLESDLTPAFELSNRNALFLVGFAGWMPTAVSAAIFQSLWTCAKAREQGKKLPLADVRFDFNFGYFVTVALAFCFLLLGATLIESPKAAFNETPTAFATQIITMFVGTIGDWSYYFISVLAFSVMLSSVFTVLDACPRALSVIASNFHSAENNSVVDQGEKYYLPMLLLQTVGSSLFLFVFLDSFSSFIDFVASVSFLSAPFIAFFNYRAMQSEALSKTIKLSLAFRVWSVAGIAALGFFALFYLYVRLVGLPA